MHGRNRDNSATRALVSELRSEGRVLWGAGDQLQGCKNVTDDSQGSDLPVAADAAAAAWMPLANSSIKCSAARTP